MRKSLLAGVAAAVVLSASAFGTCAAAMTPAAPTAPFALGAAGVSASVSTRVAIVCGIGGCAPISVKRVWHPPRGFVQRAAPLNMPASNRQPQNVSANK